MDFRCKQAIYFSSFSLSKFHDFLLFLWILLKDGFLEIARAVKGDWSSRDKWLIEACGAWISYSRAIYGPNLNLGFLSRDGRDSWNQSWCRSYMQTLSFIVSKTTNIFRSRNCDTIFVCFWCFVPKKYFWNSRRVDLYQISLNIVVFDCIFIFFINVFMYFQNISIAFYKMLYISGKFQVFAQVNLPYYKQLEDFISHIF